MIIWIILVLSILAFSSWLFIEKKWLCYILGTLTTLALIFNITLLSLNMSNHFGMKKMTTTKETKIYTASPIDLTKGMVITKAIGQNNTIVIYRNTNTDKSASVHFKPNTKDKLSAIKMTSFVEQNESVKEASVTVKTTRWVYESDGYKKLFDFGDRETLVSKKYTVNLPKDWLIVEK